MDIPVLPCHSFRTLLIGFRILAIAILSSFASNSVNADPLRYKVTGKVDPATGCRLEYSVSNQYQQEDMLKILKRADSNT